MLAVYPQLGDIAIEYAWPGIMGYAPHMMPQVGEIDRACGCARRSAATGWPRRRPGPMPWPPASPARTTAGGYSSRFGVRWAGGPLGRLATQLVYWQLQASDWWDEKRQARNAETLRT